MKYSDEKLWDYIHGLLDSLGITAIDEDRSKSKELDARISRMLLMHHDLERNLKHAAPKGFADSVMLEFSALQVEGAVKLKTRINTNYVGLLFGFLAASLLICLILVIANINWNSAVHLVSDDQIHLAQDLLSDEMFMNIIVGAVLTLCLYYIDVLLDLRKGINLF